MWVPIGSSAPCGLTGGGAGNGRAWSREPRERQLPGLRPGHLRCSLRLGLGLPWSRGPGSLGRSEAGRPSESAESRLFPARRLPPALLPCGHAPRCPLTVWPLPPSTATALAPLYSNTSRRVRDPATRTSASVPSLTLPFRLECLPSLRRPWLPGTTTHLSPAPRRPPPAREGSPQNPSLPQATSALCKCFCPGTWHPVFHLFTCLSPLLDCESLRAWTVSYASLCFCA